MHLQTKRVTARSDGLFVGNLQVITVILPEAASTRFRIFVAHSAPKTYGFNEVHNSCYCNSLFALRRIIHSSIQTSVVRVTETIEEGGMLKINTGFLIPLVDRRFAIWDKKILIKLLD
uniref:uncharacterized protein LOC117157950 n=1 Tax=Bombus vancouverensis nearcticus TaxID=2705178 RepID=UPI00143C2655|nr:uncharacterized protein LOC117157950 [Bombus vancouverensis nearcticus]